MRISKIVVLLGCLGLLLAVGCGKDEDKGSSEKKPPASKKPADDKKAKVAKTPLDKDVEKQRNRLVTAGTRCLVKLGQ